MYECSGQVDQGVYLTLSKSPLSKTRRRLQENKLGDYAGETYIQYHCYCGTQTILCKQRRPF